MAPRLYTQEELEEIFRRRLKDQEDLIGKVAERAVEAIRPEFNKVNERIDSLTEQVKKTNGQVAEHSELFGDLGVEDASKEERQALPEVLGEHVQTKQLRKAIDRRARRRAVGQQFAVNFVSTATGIVLALVAVLAYLAARGLLP